MWGEAMRKRRIVSAVATVISGLLLASIVTLWVRGMWVRDLFYFESKAWIRSVTSESGIFSYTVQRDFLDEPPGSRVPSPVFDGRGFRHDFAPTDFPFNWKRLGFGFTQYTIGIDRRDRVEIVEIHIPCWALALAFGWPPGLSLIRWFRRRRVAPGCCIHCGYDLRAHKVGDKCPECGAAISLADVG
jgi:hypothetical protein